MDQAGFKAMWEQMQDDGYFKNHPHYKDYFGLEPSEEDKALDAQILKLDFSKHDIEMPAPYSETLERAVKRTESEWLYKMFDLPVGGTALDLGCGFGRSVVWLRERYNKVLATDISSSVIELAQRLIQSDNVEFYVNDADRLPAAIESESIDVAYIFTVFQHIPREFAGDLLQQVAEKLSPGGLVVFNLISDVNETVNDGVAETEWAIGYSRPQAESLIADAELGCERIVRWYRPENDVSWLWVAARKPGGTRNTTGQ